jgi:hypothetical protein
MPAIRKLLSTRRRVVRAASSATGTDVGPHRRLLVRNAHELAMPLRRSHGRACARRGVQPAQQARTHPLDGFRVNWLDVAFEGHNLGMAESPAFRTGYMSLLLPSSTGDLEVQPQVFESLRLAVLVGCDVPIPVGTGVVHPFLANKH